MQAIMSIIPFVLIFAVFWFFLIRPQRKQQKEHNDMLDNLSVGDRVVTIGGIKAKVIKIKDDMVRLRISSNVDIDVIKNAIGRLDKSQNQEKEESETQEEG